VRRDTNLKIAEELAEFAATGSDGAADSTCTINTMVDEKKKKENWREKNKGTRVNGRVRVLISTGRTS
jgi:hypothetical protein